MNRREFLRGFEFHNHEVIDKQVGTKTDLEDSFLVSKWDGRLGDCVKASLPEFVSKHDFIDRLEQARTELRMDAKGRIQYAAGYSIFWQFVQPLRASATFA